MAAQNPNGTRHEGDCLHQDSDYLTDPDTMSSATEVAKSRTDGADPASTKPAKKETPTKQGDSKSQPTAEQLRIAQLISSKKEDPKLKEKLKQVMDATQRTMEEAYVALHDNEFDANRAVNLLLEGDVETEWSTLSKKKKPRTPGEAKPAKSKIENAQEFTHQYESWEPRWVLDAKPSIGTRGQSFKGGKGGRSARGRGSSFQQSDFGQRGKRFNRPSNTSNTCESENDSIIQSRTFERVNPPAVRPVDIWDPKRPIATMLNQKRNYELEEEEYTGSLTSSLVYTSSGSSKQKIEQTIMNIPPRRETRSPNLYDDSINTPTLPSIPSPSKEYCVPILRVVPQNNPITSMPPPSLSTSVSPEALNIRLLQLGANSKKPPTVDQPEETTVDNVTCKQLGTITKVPSKSVEMLPLSAKNSGGLLDIQFESLDLKDSSSDAVNSSLQPNILPTSKLTENIKTNLKKSESFPITFCGSSTADSLPPTSLSLDNDNICPVPGCSQKLDQAPLVCSSKYTGGLVITTAHIKSTSLSQSKYSISSGGMSTGTSNIYPQYHSSYVAQPSQSIPVASNYPYQNILGTQSYTSGSQSIYASNTPAMSSYTTPYQAYGSTAHHKPTLPQPFKTSKSFDSRKDLSTRSAVTTASSMLTTNQSLSSTKPTTAPKSTVLPNMPPMIGPQHTMFIGQGGIPYYQPPIYYQDMQLMQQQRLPSPMNTGYYEMGYPSLPRDSVPYNPNTRVPFQQDSSQPGRQLTGASGHTSSSAIFGTETERYLDPSQNTSRRNVMGSSSNDPKRTNVFQKKK